MKRHMCIISTLLMVSSSSLLPHIRARASLCTQVNMRLNELLNAVKFAEASTVVLVSHSNLLRALMGRRLHPSLRDEKPALTQIAGAQKLKNCAIVRLELDFTQDLSNGVMALEPMFVDQPEAAFLPPGK